MSLIHETKASLELTNNEVHTYRARRVRIGGCLVGMALGGVAASVGVVIGSDFLIASGYGTTFVSSVTGVWQAYQFGDLIETSTENTSEDYDPLNINEVTGKIA